MLLRALALASLGLALLACDPPVPAPTPPPPGVTTAPPQERPAPATSRRRATVHEGGALARAPFERALYLADEDHGVLRRIPLPVDATVPHLTVRLPGPPAAVLPLDGLVLVTVRDPGLLLALRPDPDRGLVEIGRTPLPPDAWGLAVTPDESTALVTSAFSSRVSSVELATLEKRWSIEVPREPRAVVVRPDGVAYVTHLAGRALTRLDLLDGAPTARSIDLLPAPATAPVPASDDHPVDASLAYSAVLSSDGERLFVPRHALGTTIEEGWFGRAVVDVLLTADDSALAPVRLHHGRQRDFFPQRNQHTDAAPQMGGSLLAGPRAAVHRRSTGTLLVASEGKDLVAEPPTTTTATPRPSRP